MIVGISGSPRQQATEHILTEALKTLDKEGFRTELFTVRGRQIGFCLHCDYCLLKKGCRTEDDMYELYPLLKEARGIIIASPVYNGGVSAQTKAVIDRCRALVAADQDCLKHKVGIAIAVGGDRIGGQELAMQQIITFYLLNGIIPVSGGSFGANLGAAFWSKDSLDQARQDEEGFRTLKKTLKKFTEFLKKIEPEKQRSV